MTNVNLNVNDTSLRATYPSVTRRRNNIGPRSAPDPPPVRKSQNWLAWRTHIFPPPLSFTRDMIQEESLSRRESENSPILIEFGKRRQLGALCTHNNPRGNRTEEDFERDTRPSSFFRIIARQIERERERVCVCVRPSAREKERKRWTNEEKKRRGDKN